MKDFKKAKNQFIFYAKMCDKKLKLSLFFKRLRLVLLYIYIYIYI